MIKSNTGKVTRDFRFELLRICSMLLIVISHLISHGGVLENIDVGTINYWITWMIKGVCRVSVPAFVMLDGYFMCEKNFRFRKLVILWSGVAFYETVISTMLIYRAGKPFSVIQIVYDVMPIMSGRYWFITQYVMLMIVSPILNRAMKQLSRKEHLRWILCCVLVFSLFANVFSAIYDFSKTEAGYSFVWFVVLYVTAAYLKKWPLRVHSLRFWSVGYIIFAFLNVAVTNIIELFQVPLFCYAPTAFYDINSIFTYLASICFFMIFKQGLRKVHPRVNLQKRILSVGKLTLGVYLISDNIAIREFLWIKELKIPYYANSWKLWPYSIVCVVGIFTVCCGIEKIRTLLFDKILINSVVMWIANKICMCYEKGVNWISIRL